MPVTADPLLLGQAVLNLLLNAAEAMRDSGGPGDCVGSLRRRRRTARTPGSFTWSCRTAGPGIPPHVLDRIFNPFFTTKDTGTGLGLAIVHRIVEAHDGTILVTNAPERRGEVRDSDES